MSTVHAGTVLVTGATGTVGRHVVAGLLAEGVRVRALVRRPPTAALPAGVEVVPGDLGRPGSVGAAADGADAAFLLWPGFSAAGADDVVTQLARRVPHVVHLSAARLQHGEEGATAGVWADVEALLQASGARATFLRAGGFAANTLAWAPRIRAGDTVALPHPDAARSLVHERDVADVAVRALVDPALTGRMVAVTGPEVLTQRAQVRAIGAAVGRDLRVVEQSTEDALGEYAATMGAEYAAAALAHWATLVDEPERATDDVERVTGHPARPFARWARDHVADFGDRTTTAGA